MCHHLLRRQIITDAQHPHCLRQHAIRRVHGAYNLLQYSTIAHGVPSSHLFAGGAGPARKFRAGQLQAAVHLTLDASLNLHLATQRMQIGW